MKVALVQQHATRDKADNISRGIEALAEAASNGAKLVAYAELAFEYFLPQHPASRDSLAKAEPIPGPTTGLFGKRAKELGVVVVINLFERDGARTFDTSPVIDADGRIVGKNRMVHVIEAPCFHERGYYTPGDMGAGVFDTAAGRIGVAICYDRHFPEYMRALALRGADVVVIPQAGAVDEWPPGVYEAEIRIAAFQNGYFAALVNRVGEEELLAFSGESFIAGPDGRVLARAPGGEDCILYYDIESGQLEDCYARRHFLPDRRPDIYETL